MSEHNEPQKVEIVGLHIPFLDLVAILVKLAFAAIPAAIVVGFFVMMWIAFIGSAVR